MHSTQVLSPLVEYQSNGAQDVQRKTVNSTNMTHTNMFGLLFFLANGLEWFQNQKNQLERFGIRFKSFYKQANRNKYNNYVTKKKKKKHIVLYYCHLCNTDFLLEPILYYLFFNKICKQQCNGAQMGIVSNDPSQLKI